MSAAAPWLLRSDSYTFPSQRLLHTNMKKITLPLVLGLFAVVAMAAAPAMRAVTFDSDPNSPTYGQGFVGKGDVQIPFGWNNATLQANANATPQSIFFTYHRQERGAFTCEWSTGPVHNRKTHTIDRQVMSNVNSTVAYDARTRRQVTGFNLTGLTSENVSGGALPQVGDSCPGQQGAVTEVEEFAPTGVASLTVSSGALSADLMF